MKKKASKTVRTRKAYTDDTRGELELKIEPRGPDRARTESVSSALANHPLVRQSLVKTRNRLLSFEFPEPDPETKSARPAPPPSAYRATFYDYTNNRAILVDGDLKQPKQVRVSESGSQPLPTYEEFAEAVKLLMKDEEFGAALRDGQLKPYRPMPPLIDVESPHGRKERTIAVGLLSPRSEARHEIVGVNLIQQGVIRFDDGAPGSSRAFGEVCGPDYTQQATTTGTAGQVWVTVSQGRHGPLEISGGKAGGFFGNTRLGSRIALRGLPRQAGALSRACSNPECPLRRPSLRSLSRLAKRGRNDPGQRG